MIGAADAAALRAHLHAFLVEGRRVLGVAGPPGAGKSTLAERLVSSVDGAVLVPMDGFHLADDELDRLGRHHRKGAPDTFDVDGYVAALERIRRRDRDVVVPRFDRSLEAAIAGSIRVSAAAPLVVTEGNYLLFDDPGWRRVATLLDACWWVDVDDAERRRRLVDRHVAHGRSPAAAARWVDEVDDPNARAVRDRRIGEPALVVVTG